MLAAIVQIALALEILLVCAEGAIPRAAFCLPLGGSHLAQIGLMLGSAVAVVGIWEAFTYLRGG